MKLTGVPDSIQYEMAALTQFQQPLLPKELSQLDPRAGVRRKMGFTAGRNLARKLLSQFGHSDFALLSGVDGQPLWPQDMVGSISHCRDWVFVAVARREDVGALGVDIEQIDRFHEGLISPILTDEEASHLPDQTEQRQIDLAIGFSAKEAFYKYQFVEHGLRLHFADARVHKNSNALGLRITMSDEGRYGHLTNGLCAAYGLSQSHVATMVWRHQKS